MNILQVGIATLCFSSLLMAQSTVRPRAKATGDTTPAATNAEVFVDIVIAAGKNVVLESAMDFSTVSTVAVTISCTVCTTDKTALGTSGLVLQARWAIPDADSYVATEYKAATLFPYWDAGGVVFNVFGSMFRLNLQNKGTESITIQQVTLFRRGS